MSLTTSLLYLLLLYAVLDPERKLSLSTGLIIAAAILLFNCYRGQQCQTNARRYVNGGFPPPNIFSELNF